MKRFVPPNTARQQAVDRLARNLAEVIHELYRDGAAPRSDERMIELVSVQVKRAYQLGARGGRVMSKEEET